MSRERLWLMFEFCLGGIRSLNLAKSWPVMQTRSRCVCSVFHHHPCLWHSWVRFHLISCVESVRDRNVDVTVSNMMATSTGALNSILWARLCSGSLSPQVGSNADGWNPRVFLPVLLKASSCTCRTIQCVWSVLTHCHSEDLPVLWCMKWKVTVGYKIVMDDLGGCIQL